MAVSKGVIYHHRPEPATWVLFSTRRICALITVQLSRLALFVVVILNAGCLGFTSIWKTILSIITPLSTMLRFQAAPCSENRFYLRN